MEATIRINGEERSLRFPGDAVLLDVLRQHGYTEVKEGCREGACGACLVLLDGLLVNSCQVLAGSAAGREVTTVRGIGSFQVPHPIQEAFVEAGAVQCGFCTPGMVLAAYALLQANPRPDEGEIARALDGNLCRCTGSVKVVEAVRLAAKRLAATRPTAARPASARGGKG
ncbi:MAG: (2Fe-2S)-binding protein [Spirochaetales bacterium]|nr:(2Fe-2S)-binding protein [Spirochaetales bacterium]